MKLEYKFGEVDAHGAVLQSQAGALEAEHQAILKHLNEAADFWGGAGSTGFQEFVTELNRNFAIIFQELHGHGGKVKNVNGNTEHTDAGVGGTWSI